MVSAERNPTPGSLMSRAKFTMSHAVEKNAPPAPDDTASWISLGGVSLRAAAERGMGSERNGVRPNSGVFQSETVSNALHR